MTLTGMLTSDVSILIVPSSPTTTGVLSASGRFGLFSLSESLADCFSVCDDGDEGGGCPFRPDCAEPDELMDQNKPATSKITTKHRANNLLFINTSSIFARLKDALTERGKTAGPTLSD